MAHARRDSKSPLPLARLATATLSLVAWMGAGLPISPAYSQSATAAPQDEAIPTAAGAPTGGAPEPSSEPSYGARPLRLDDRLDTGPGFLRPAGPCGGPAKTADGKTDKTPHGEVWAGVGTRGYREAGGAVCVPLGENSALTIAVDAGHVDGYGRRR
jgi:hypothetical protein